MKNPERRTAPWRTDLKPLTDTSLSVSTIPEGQTFAGESMVVRYVNLVKLPHTLFALPFALIGVIYASYRAPVSVRQAVAVLVAFTAARFAAMGFNRIVDRKLDALNPRTGSRELPAGKLTPRQAGIAVAVAAVVFIAAAAALNRICLLLSPVALAWILAYSYTKRFTSWSHLWLGASLAIAPVGGYLAVTGSWSTPAWVLLALSGAVITWVAGFDILYALQDESFDRAHGLKSAVVLLGDRRSIMLARVLHLGTVALLGTFTVGAESGMPFRAGVVLTAVLLLWEHRLVRPGDLTRLNAAFFNMNGIISILLLVAALADRML